MLLFNQITGKTFGGWYRFQNILCYCLTIHIWTYGKRNIISKHPMLLFNSATTATTAWTFAISKHPMLLFNQCNECCRLWHRQISKHPMLLFNGRNGVIYRGLQIISKHPMLLFNLKVVWMLAFHLYFKTSYVTV